jgi:hypothetical protein
MALKLDVDKYSRRGFSGYLLPLFFSLPLPFSVRRSSSGRGLHVKCNKLPSDHYLRYVFDDPMRVKLDDDRAFEGMPLHNLFWDVKNGKRAYKWRCIRSQRALLDFINEFAHDQV